MKRTFLLVLAAAMIVALTLAGGCGGDETTTTAAVETTVSLDTTGGSAEGAALFASNCAVCHGAEGQGGNGPDIRPLADADKDRIVKQVTNGGNAMPPFGGQLDAAEIDAVAAYVISLQ